MLSFQEFFVWCAGQWTTERTYHHLDRGAVERSHTDYGVTPLSLPEKQQLLAANGDFDRVLARDRLAMVAEDIPGFAIAFATVSATGEGTAMSLKALFVPEALAPIPWEAMPALPATVQATTHATTGEAELVRGYYLRDVGYSEAGAIAGYFTYSPARHALEMTTFYRRSVAVDRMQFASRDVRFRAIVTYRRPASNAIPPSDITLTGVGVEQRQALAT